MIGWRPHLGWHTSNTCGEVLSRWCSWECQFVVTRAKACLSLWDLQWNIECTFSVCVTGWAATWTAEWFCAGRNSFPCSVGCWHEQHGGWLLYAEGPTVQKMGVLCPLVLKVAREESGFFDMRKTYSNVLRHFFCKTLLGSCGLKIHVLWKCFSQFRQRASQIWHDD